MKLGIRATVAFAAMLVSACGQQPIKPAETHISAEDARPPAGSIPPPVQISPVLPPPKPTARPETYSVVVNNVRLSDLLFALARDAKINIDINPDVTGTVTLNAIDQTLPQLLARITRQADIRYEIVGQNLYVMRDTPVLRAYKIDYISATRNVKMQSTASTVFGGSATGAAGTAGAAGGAGGTGGNTQIDVTADNKLWESIVVNVREILRETDRIIPATQPAAAAAPVPSPAPVAPGGMPAPTSPSAQPQPVATYQEAASVIANRESGILYVRATAKQHEKVQEFIDQVMAGAKRQVLIEATVAEVQLRNEYQRGIDWRRLRSGQTGISLDQQAITPPSGFNLNPFLVGYVSAGNNFSVTLKLLEQFGDVRVVSSPKLSVLNNQTAVLRVTRDIIYFTLTPSTTPITVSGSGIGGVDVVPSFTTTPNVAAEGFMMAVLPQINDTDTVVLNVRPTIRRKVADEPDPNPALIGTSGNRIPVFETREFDSIMRVQSGDIAVLAGLMQDSVENTVTGIPGIRSIPFLGEALSNRSDLTRKTELVIFLRATVIKDPSVQGDFANFRNQLPRDDFFSRPNPQRVAPPLGPGEAQLQ